MHIELSNEAAEKLAFNPAGAIVDAKGDFFQRRCAAELAALPALTGDGAFSQKPGVELLLEWAKAQAAREEVDPGYIEVTPYREVDFSDESGFKRAELKCRLRWHNGKQTYNPAWEREVVRPIKGKKGKKGEVEEVLGNEIAWTIVEGAPYLRHVRRLLTVEVQEGVVQLDNPDMPCKVVDEFEGRTDDLRPTKIRLAPDVDHKTLCSLGIHVDVQGWGRWREIMRAQAGANARQITVYCTPAKGWIKFPGCDAAHYVFGDRVVAPRGAPELRATTRGGNGPADPIGVQTQGTFQAQKDAMALVLRNPDMAALLGFSASSALLGLIPEMEAGIVHLVGGSSRGKSTALKVAASLIGSADGPKEANAYVQSWNSTENAMEGPLEARSDAPSFYDELYELPRNVDILALLYRATNGRGKRRMTKEIEARMVKVWKTQILSTGEGSFASRIAQEGHEYFPGGLQFRVIELLIDLVDFWADVAAQAELPNHGVYGDLVARHRSSAPTAAGRVIEGIELELKANHGHFWERWIASLQDTRGLDEARSWFEQERAALQSHIPENANPIFVRRAKHIAASMAGLRGIVSVFGYSAEEQAKVLDASRAWSIQHMWAAGLDKMGQEGDSIYSRFEDWLMANEVQFYRVSDRHDPVGSTVGWIDRDGSAAVLGAELSKIAAGLKIDLGRLERSMLASGWEKSRRRHPRSGKHGNPLSVWTAKQHFNAPAGAVASAEEVFGVP